MARRNLSIPYEVKNSIKKHLKERCEIALEGYESANEEEDTLTGDLGATLRIKNQKVEVKEAKLSNQGTWNWSITYNKFRGRGPSATENVLGADGIFELTLNIGNVIEKKSIMFQSKKDWEFDPNILVQSIKLSNWREAAFVLNFTSNIYQAFDLDTVIAAKGNKPPAENSNSLETFLGRDFLDCIVGDVNLSYDSKLRKLRWLTMNEEFVVTKFSIPHKIALKITAPNTEGNDKTIQNSEVFNHRMKATPEELLSLEYGYTEAELRKARIKAAKSFHLDTTNVKDDLLVQLHNMRMQEFNNAFDELKVKFKKT